MIMQHSPFTSEDLKSTTVQDFTTFTINNPVNMRIILYVVFPNIDNDVVLSFAACLPTDVWLILVTKDGSIVVLIDHSKTQGLSRLLM